jgi:hypothetical protein
VSSRIWVCPQGVRPSSYGYQALESSGRLERDFDGGGDDGVRRRGHSRTMTSGWTATRTDRAVLACSGRPYRHERRAVPQFDALNDVR